MQSYLTQRGNKSGILPKTLAEIWNVRGELGWPGGHAKMNFSAPCFSRLVGFACPHFQHRAVTLSETNLTILERLPAPGYPPV